MSNNDQSRDRTGSSEGMRDAAQAGGAGARPGPAADVGRGTSMGNPPTTSTPTGTPLHTTTATGRTTIPPGIDTRSRPTGGEPVAAPREGGPAMSGSPVASPGAFDRDTSLASSPDRAGDTFPASGGIGGGGISATPGTATRPSTMGGGGAVGSAGGNAARPGADSEGMKESASHLADQAREGARRTADQIQERARAEGERIRERVESTAEERKSRAAETTTALADALRAAGTTLRDRNEQRLGGFTDEIADQVERFSGYLRDHDMRSLMGELEDVARRNPTGFLGSTLAAGLVAGRFLRSSGSGEEDRERGAARPNRMQEDGFGHEQASHRTPSHREFNASSGSDAGATFDRGGTQ